MILDIVAGALCGWLALCALVLHIFSSPHRRRWMTIPEYVRGGFLITGAMFTWRSVNFFSVSADASIIGHINGEGIMALVAVAYTTSALACWILLSALPDQGWSRLRFFEGLMRAGRGVVPVPATMRDVVDQVRARGMPAVGPQEGPQAVAREGKPH